MSRYVKHKRHQYNDGKPTKGKNPPRESFLNNDRTSTTDGDELREDSLYIFLLDEWQFHSAYQSTFMKNPLLCLTSRCYALATIPTNQRWRYTNALTKLPPRDVTKNRNPN